MSEKEQLQAVRLLQGWLALVSKLPRERRTPEAAELLDKTERFLNLEDAADREESHGQRRG